MSDDTVADALPPGTRLLWFEIVSTLGKGGFGITYLGKDSNLDQWVAIKEYLPSAYASRGSHNAVYPNSPLAAKTFEWGLDRFLKEAQILAQFNHPSIVRVISFFRSGNTAYMVMEYVEGEGLDKLLRRNTTLDEPRLKTLLPALLDGLEILHKAHYIHRDLKPANILLRKKDETPVLLDFGSARQSVAGQGEQMTSLLSMGYSPFEQYDSTGDRQGPWSDIYALSAVLYRAISGRRPLEASIRIAARLRNAPDPLPSATEMGRGRYTPEFLHAVDKGLQVLETERPQSIREWRPMLLGVQPPSFSSITQLTRDSTLCEDGSTTVKTTSWRGFISALNLFSSRVVVQERAACAIPEVVAPKAGEVQRIIPATRTALPVAVSPREESGTVEVTPPPQRDAGEIWEEPITKMAFVWVPGGVFTMGASGTDPNRKEDEGPEHTVQLDGFWIAKYPMTWGKWRRIMGDYPAGLFMNSRANHPVERITWLDTQKFIDKLGRMIGTQYTFRLPSEAEWECAARAGATYLPPLHPSTLQFGTELLTDYAWCRANARGQSHPIGEKLANAWGIHDMLGNVWEWVSDRYQADYYSKSPRINPQGPAEIAVPASQPLRSVSRFDKRPAAREMRVARGGGFNSAARECWPTSRLRMAENDATVTVGFRLVRQA
ncbi:MAG: SUMF1/EgtB/PvdO family nonheme iron enzyme [Magnetococcales bacterium]|nr:SUMF1/EgtB/PvdO family nonheme iron enzyme [Magnetococcales bacterium]